jgi:hypothetical protein
MRGRWHRNRVYAPTLLSCALLASACGHRDTPATEIIDEATATYGYGPVANPAVTYQPNVIIVSGGPKAIKSGSADGLTFVIDGQAPHAKELTPGKILLATSRAAGRIMSTAPVGNDIAVTLGPTQMGDILRNATLKGTLKLNPSAFLYQTYPQLPGMYYNYHAPDEQLPPPTADQPPQPPQEMTVEQTAEGLLIHLLPIRMAQADSILPDTRRPTGDLPLATRTAPKISYGNWEFEPSYRRDTPAKGSTVRDRIGMNIAYNLGSQAMAGAEAGAKIGIDIGLWAEDMQIEWFNEFTDGVSDKQGMTMVIYGLRGLDVDIQTGIERAVGDNKKVRVEVPIEWIVPVPPPMSDGVPLVMQVELKFLVEMGLGGNNATLTGSGKYEINGPLGIKSGKLATPSIKETAPIISSVKGVSLGASAVVFAAEFRYLLGLGPPSLFMGPYVKLTTAYSITKGADIAAMMLPLCRATTFKVDGGYGMGFALRPKESEMLKALLGDKFKGEWEVADQVQTLYRTSSYSPEVNACRI